MNAGRRVLNEDLLIWLKQSKGRGSALARELNVSRQYISAMSKSDKGLSLKRWNEFKLAMTVIEGRLSDE